MIEAHDTFRLKLFFFELLKMATMHSGRPGWGNPCSGLLEKLILRQEPFFQRIAGDHTWHSNEMRLNDAGLKMYWTVDKETRAFTCTISGDQEKEYPEFVEAARMLMRSHGVSKRG